MTHRVGLLDQQILADIHLLWAKSIFADLNKSKQALDAANLNNLVKLDLDECDRNGEFSFELFDHRHNQVLLLK